MAPIPLRFTKRNYDGPMYPGSFTLEAPLRFDFYKQQISLTSALLYYSWRNITTTYQNNSFAYIWTNGTTYPINLPDGNYQVSDLNNILQSTMKANGHYTPANPSANPPTSDTYYLSITDNPVYYTNTIVSSPEPNTNMTPQFVITTQSFGNLIGYTVGSYPPTQQSTVYETNGSIVPEISPVQAIQH